MNSLPSKNFNFPENISKKPGLSVRAHSLTGFSFDKVPQVVVDLPLFLEFPFMRGY